MHLLKYVHLANSVRVGSNERTYFTQTPDPMESNPIAYDIYLYKNGMIRIAGKNNEGWTTLNNVKGFEPFSSKELEIFADGQQEKEPKQEEKTSGNNREMGRNEHDQERSAEKENKEGMSLQEFDKALEKEFAPKITEHFEQESSKAKAFKEKVQQSNSNQGRPGRSGKRTSAKKAKGK